MINSFKEKGINFISLENNIDTTTPLGMILFSMCAEFSEMERELIRERVKAGLDSARNNGRSGGRPKSLSLEKEKVLRNLCKSNDMSVKQICGVVGITRSVYYRAMNKD
jgi:DNA invertase Pin-like site-specific DNA recombinase